MTDFKCSGCGKDMGRVGQYMQEVICDDCTVVDTAELDKIVNQLNIFRHAYLGLRVQCHNDFNEVEWKDWDLLNDLLNKNEMPLRSSDKYDLDK